MNIENLLRKTHLFLPTLFPIPLTAYFWRSTPVSTPLPTTSQFLSLRFQATCVEISWPPPTPTGPSK